MSVQQKACPEPSRRVSPKQIRESLNKLPQVKLCELPTPLHDCPRLSQAVGKVRLLIKRDDLTGLAFGGNKSRMFDFIFGDALKEGADCVIAGAASQSNFARQSAAAAAKLGLKCYLVNRLDARAEKVGIQGNYLLDCILGAEVRLAPAELQHQAKLKLMDELKAKGHKPYLLTDREPVLGAVSYVGCVLELYEQLQQKGLSCDYIAVCSGSGTQAGICLGAKALGMDCKVLGFRPSHGDDTITKQHVAESANKAAQLLGLDVRLSHDEIQTTSAYVGEAYGIVTKEGLDAIELVARTEGILLDPVYTGKAMAGLIDFIRKGIIEEGKTVVFIHTGGNPALFAYAPELIEHGGYQMVVVGGS